MGNCQAAEAATVVIQRSGDRCNVERIYWSVSAGEVMASNPGHYVAMVVDATAADGGASVKRLKLLRSDDTLVLGRAYRLISFEDVLKEFAAKKSAKLGKLLKHGGVYNADPAETLNRKSGSSSSSGSSTRRPGNSQGGSGNRINSSTSGGGGVRGILVVVVVEGRGDRIYNLSPSLKLHTIVFSIFDKWKHQLRRSRQCKCINCKICI